MGIFDRVKEWAVPAGAVELGRAEPPAARVALDATDRCGERYAKQRCNLVAGHAGDHQCWKLWSAWPTTT